LKNKLAVIASLSAMFVLILASEELIACSTYALRLCTELILPSLFPFFVMSVLLSKLGFPIYLGKLLSPVASRLFGVSGAGASALFLGVCGGYPLGAAYIADMQQSGAISLKEAEKLLAFCNNSGPAFIIGAIGAAVFGSAAVGIYLYLIHIISAILTGILFSLSSRSEKDLQHDIKPEFLPFSQALPEAVRQAVISVLNVCGFVVCFTVFTGLLDTGGFFSTLSGAVSSFLGTELRWSRALLTGFLELGSGAGAMRGLSVSGENLALAAAMLGWGGLSVHFQTMSVISDTEIKGTLHFAGRLVSAVIAAVLAGSLSFML